jgi:hypothetical protein
MTTLAQLCIITRSQICQQIGGELLKIKHYWENIHSMNKSTQKKIFPFNFIKLVLDFDEWCQMDENENNL